MCLVLSEELFEMVKTMAKRSKSTASSQIRYLIAKEWIAVGGGR